jgi:hypothetical protein
MELPLSNPRIRCSWGSANPCTTLGYIRFAEDLASHARKHHGRLSPLPGWTRAFLQ